MFSSPIPGVMIAAVILSMIFIMAAVYFVYRMFNDDTQDVLVRFILIVFTALVGVYVVDKVIAFRKALLDPKQDEQLFDLIKSLLLMIFSYYFGTKNVKK